MPRPPNQDKKAIARDLVLLRRICGRAEQSTRSEDTGRKLRAALRTAIEVLENEVVS